MRDTDCDVRSVIVVRAESNARQVEDLGLVQFAERPAVGGHVAPQGRVSQRDLALVVRPEDQGVEEELKITADV